MFAVLVRALDLHSAVATHMVDFNRSWTYLSKNVSGGAMGKGLPGRRKLDMISKVC
jgi:hypothetical protein